MRSIYYQDRINERQRLKYLLTLLRRGIKRVEKNKNILISSLIVLLAELVFIAQKICNNPSENGIQELLWFLNTIATIVIVLIADMTIIALLGSPITYGGYMKKLIRAGVINEASEPPLLVSKKEIIDGEFIGCKELVFDAPGTSITEWEDAQEKIESAFNQSILQIDKGATVNQIKMIVANPDAHLETFVPWNDIYLNSEDDATYSLGIALPNRLITCNTDTEPMMAICGTTGSGKSTLVKSLIYQAINKNVDVYLIDLKRGVDYGTYFRNNCTFLCELEEIDATLNSIVIEMKKRFDTFASIDNVTNILSYRSQGYSMKRVLVVVDELAQITDTRGVSKDTKNLLEKIDDSIIKISQLGRAVGITLIVSGQRLDQQTFPGQLRSNINVKICGKADENLSTVVYGDRRADEKVPKNVRGRFMLEDGTLFQGFYNENI